MGEFYSEIGHKGGVKVRKLIQEAKEAAESPKQLQVFSFDMQELNDELEGEASDEKRFPDNECPKCGWETNELYVYAYTLEQAHKLIVDGKAGKCGRCFAEMLTIKNFGIVEPKTNVKEEKQTEDQ